MSRKTVIDFYEVEVENGKNNGFAAVLKEAHALPDNERRPVETEHGHIRVDETATDGSGLWTGDLVRIRMDNLPVKASIRGSKKDLGLRADEGLGEETAFLFEPSCNVLVLQRTRLGVSMGRFADYFARVIEWQPLVTLKPILSCDALERLKAMSELRQMQVRVKAPNGSAFLKNSGVSVAGVADIMEELHASSVSITFGVSRSDRSLNKNRIIDTCTSLLRFTHKREEVKTLRMVGRNADDEVIPLDFIKDRIYFEAELTTGADRRISYTERKRAVRQAWTAKHQEVLKILAES